MSADIDEDPTDPVVKLKFELSDSSVPVMAVTGRGDCRFKLEEMVPHSEASYRTYYSFEGCDPARVLELATEHGTSDAHLLHRGQSAGLVELLVEDDLPTVFLATHGALPRRSVVEDGTMTLSAEVPPEYDTNGIIARFTQAYPDATLTARRQQSYVTPLFSHRELERAIGACLTDRQHEVFQVAHEEGFYEWPREVTGEQLSKELGIAPPTFHQHLRKAEQTLVRLVFGEDGLHGHNDQRV